MNAYELASPQRKLVMWYKCKEKNEMGLTRSQISRELGINIKTVRKYLKMSYDDFISSESYKRMYLRILDPYETIVCDWLHQHPDLSSSQVHDWLREKYADLPCVNPKTVFNFVRYIRAKYNLTKPSVSSPRQYFPVEETPYGEFAQADFGEMWMQREDGRRLKVYFFVMVMCRSRKKYVYFNSTPFNTAMTIYAHEKAFEYYGGKPKKIIYDQDSVLIHDENYGDCLLTKAFNAFVNQEHIECIFCRKSDPESKGKVENVVKYVKYNFLKCRTFYDIAQLNDEGVRWLSRTANGLPHNTIKRIPDNEFLEEQKYLIPYYGKPSIPARSMTEYYVHKSNVIIYHSNRYSVPSNTFQGLGTKVWVNIQNDVMEIYNKDTGKQIASHTISHERGKLFTIPSHRLVHRSTANKLEQKIILYCNNDNLAKIWIENLYEDKPRYYTSNLNLFIREMVHYTPQTLHQVFEKCIDLGMYNAKDFMTLCSRYGRRLPARREEEINRKQLDEVVAVTPSKTDINQYNQYFL